MIRFSRMLTLIALTWGSVLQADDFRYEPDWESIRSRYEVPEWFRDAKFGIFLHWGPYAVTEIDCKYAKGIYQQGWKKGLSWNYHREHFGDPSEVGYKDIFPLFKAEKYDAEEWVELFKQAGARYVVPVAEHHDGYAMYASNHTRWNVVDTGPKKDTMRMLADATRAAGLKFGASSHFALTHQYYSRKNPSWDTNDPEFSDLYWKSDQVNGKEPSQEFKDYWWDRTTDIIDQYQPDILWFDFGLDKPGWESVHKPILAYYYNKGLEWGKEVVFQGKNMNKTSRINGKFFHDRSVKSFPEDIIVLDLERGRMSDIRELPWQTDTSIGKKDWAYIHDEEYKTADYLLDELIDIVSKNGCLLLNIGPKADGTIPDEAKSILAGMGAWLKLNGEAIYDTRPWKVFGEGPTKVCAGNHSEKDNPDNVAADIRFTSKGDTLYAIALAWPENGVFRIESLANENPYESQAIKSVEFVSGSKAVQWRQNKKALVIRTKEEKPCEAAYVFKVTFDS